MAGSFTDLGNGFKEMYPQEVIEPLVNNEAKFRKRLKKAVPGKFKVGEGLVTFVLETGTASPVGQAADGIDLPPSMDRTDTRLVLKPTNFWYTIELGTLTLGAANSNKSAFNGGEMQRNMDNGIGTLAWFMDSTYTGTHGTGRRARVLSDGTNTFVADVPEGIKLLREGLYLSGRSTDAGSVSGSFDAQRITSIARSTRTVTYGGTDRTLTAGDHIHVVTVAAQTLTNTYANGLRGLIDDATYLASVHGQARSSFPDLNANVFSNGGVKRNLSETILMNAANDIMEVSGKGITDIWCGPGQHEKYVEFVAPDKRIMSTVTDPGLRASGYKKDEDLRLYVPGVDAFLNRSMFIVPREIYMLNMDHMFLYTSKELGLVGELTGGNTFQLSVGSNGYKSAVQAFLHAQENIGCERFDVHGVIRDLNDRHAGD